MKTMLSTPSTISRASSVPSASHAWGSVKRSIQDCLLERPRERYGLPGILRACVLTRIHQPSRPAQCTRRAGGSRSGTAVARQRWFQSHLQEGHGPMASENSTNPLQGLLDEAESDLTRRLHEACEAEAKGAVTGSAAEIRRLEDTLLSAALAAERTIVARRHLEAKAPAAPASKSPSAREPAALD